MPQPNFKSSKQDVSLDVGRHWEHWADPMFTGSQEDPMITGSQGGHLHRCPLELGVRFSLSSSHRELTSRWFVSTEDSSPCSCLPGPDLLRKPTFDSHLESYSELTWMVWKDRKELSPLGLSVTPGFPRSQRGMSHFLF